MEHADKTEAGARAARPVSEAPSPAPATALDDSPRMVAQRRQLGSLFGDTTQRQPATSGPGLPEGLKAGVESLSGMAMDGVKVHYNSSQPAQLGALAYAQGQDIHLAPGQEQHLPHEAWHVVQQAQGRVQATTQMREAVPVNDDAGLEEEADVMGARAMSLAGQLMADPQARRGAAPMQQAVGATGSPVQAKGLARIRTAAPSTGGERVITAVEFEGRMPTTLASGQGDHTVASSLITGSAAALQGFTRSQAVQHLLQLAVQTLPTDVTAGKGGSITFHTLIGQLKLAEALMAKPADGEDINAALEDAFETYVRLANKRVNTALKSDKTRTSMGGKEKEGLATLGTLRDDLASTQRKPTSEDQFKFARGCVLLVDFLPSPDALVEIPMLAEMLVRAIDHSLFVVKDADLESGYEEWAAHYTVAAWIERANMVSGKDYRTFYDRLAPLVAGGLMPTYSDTYAEVD